MTMRKKIFNPLNHIKKDFTIKEVTAADLTVVPFGKKEVDEAMVSQSAFFNEVVGVCPKCQGKMTTSTIANNDTVFFCTKDRVVLPCPDVQLQGSTDYV